MSATTKVLLAFDVHLDTLVVALRAIVHDIVDLGLGKRRVGLATRLWDDSRDVEVFIRSDGEVAANMVDGGVADDEVLETAGLDRVIVVSVAPTAETADWIIIPDGTVLQVGCI